MNRRTFLGAAAALATSLATRPPTAQATVAAGSPLDDFEPVDWHDKWGDTVPFAFFEPPAVCLASKEEIVAAHAATIYRFSRAFPGDRVELVLLTRFARGATRAEALASLRGQLEYEARLLSYVFRDDMVGRRRMWFRRPGGFLAFRSPNGDWVAHSRDRLVVIPEYAVDVKST